jgi:hypothetical protein
MSSRTVNYIQMLNLLCKLCLVQGRKQVDDKGISGKELGDLETELSGLRINKHETTTDICERAKPRYMFCFKISHAKRISFIMLL